MKDNIAAVKIVYLFFPLMAVTSEGLEQTTEAFYVEYNYISTD
jgi:hypothetical protein